MRRLPLRIRLSVVLRSLLIQAAWNYRTMLGTGMAFALLPVLRYLHRDPGALEAAVARHAAHFNAHPYLTPVALGALARLEVEGATPEVVERFRAALRGPLGALGDRLVWAGWLPFSALAGVALVQLHSPTAGVLGFLLLHNALHLLLRIRGFRFGWEAGAELGLRVRELDLGRRARWIEGGVAIALGLVVALWMPGPGQGPELLPMGIAGGGALLIGYAAGSRAWRPTAALMVGAVLLAAAAFRLG